MFMHVYLHVYAIYVNMYVFYMNTNRKLYINIKNIDMYVCMYACMYV